MRPAGAALLAMLLALPASPSAAIAIQSEATTMAPLVVEAGKGRLITLPRAAAGLFVADPTIADVEVRSPRLLYLFGRRTGETSFFAVDRADRPIASFPIRVEHDHARIEAALADMLPGRRLRATTANDSLILSGAVETAAEAEDAIRIAQRFVAGGDRARILNRLSVASPTQIHLRVRVAEVSREVVRAFGFNWEVLGSFGDAAVGLATGRPILSADVSGRGFRTRADGTDSLFASLRSGDLDINGLIDALDERGLVTVLAEPSLTALSGVPANFLAGGEYPVPVPQEGGVTTIEYKRFGVSLGFVATIAEGNRINLVVEPEVSQLSATGAITLNDIMVPALTTRRASTTVDLASGQSFAIAGLLQSGGRRDIRKFPGLGDIPVIGELFRSRRFENQETELVIIVTPYLVRPTSQALAVAPAAPLPQGCDRAATPGSPLPFGCASRRNLEAMASDPADLTAGRPLPPAEGDPVARPVDRLRRGAVPALVPTPTGAAPGP